jgi:hypothetical protein
MHIDSLLTIFGASPLSDTAYLQAHRFQGPITSVSGRLSSKSRSLDLPAKNVHIVINGAAPDGDRLPALLTREPKSMLKSRIAG